MKRIISFCLFGKNSMYHIGAMRNAYLIHDLYPGWTMRVYAEEGVRTEALEGMGVEVVRRGVSVGRGGQRWRMEPIWEYDLDAVLFRDLDSRLNEREVDAVEEWIESGLMVHAMHDHAHHTSVPLLGGMWGLRVSAARVPRPQQDIKVAVRMDDQRGLLNHVWPYVQGSCMRHVRDGVNVKWEGYRKRFAVDLGPGLFVGEQIRADGSPIVP